MSKGQYTKEMIIEKAAQLFNTKGYAGCSMSDLMAATGLKKGGIYNHFKNKDEISLEAFKFSISRLETRLAEVTRFADTEKARLTATLDFYREYAINPVIQGGCPILNTVVDADNINPELLALVRRKTERLIKGLERIVQRGQQAGEFQVQVKPRTVALTIFSGVEGALLLTRAYDDEQAIEAMITCLKSYLESAVYV